MAFKDDRFKQNHPTNITLQNRIRELENQLDEQKQYSSFMFQYEEREQENLQLKNNISDLESERQEFKNRSEKDRLEFNKSPRILETEKLNLEQQILQLQKQVTELTSKAKTSTSYLPPDIINLVSFYRQSPESFINKIRELGKFETQVSEMEESAAKRRDGDSSDVILKTPDTGIGDFWLISPTGRGASYLFPKQHQISTSQKSTAKALFDGYQSGNTEKFVLNKPAKVSPIGNFGQWKLEEKGELNYD